MGILLLLGLAVLAGVGIDPSSSEIKEDFDETIDELGLENVTTDGVDFTDTNDVSEFIDDYRESVNEWVDGLTGNDTSSEETPPEETSQSDELAENYVVFDHALSGGDVDAHHAHNHETVDYLDAMNEDSLNFDESDDAIDLGLAGFSEFGADNLGSETRDTLTGTEQHDILFGLAGDDLISAQDGNDIVWGGEGNDTIIGGDGSDMLYSVDAYNEYLLANNLYAGNSVEISVDNGRSGEMRTDGNDIVLGGNGDDTILSAGDDTLTGGEGQDMFLIGKVYEEDVVEITDYQDGELIVIYHSDFTASPTIDWKIDNGDVTIRVNGSDAVVLRDAADVFDPWLIQDLYDETIPVPSEENIDFLAPQVVN